MCTSAYDAKHFISIFVDNVCCLKDEAYNKCFLVNCEQSLQSYLSYSTRSASYAGERRKVKPRVAIFEGVSPRRKKIGGC